MQIWDRADDRHQPSTEMGDLSCLRNILGVLRYARGKRRHGPAELEGSLSFLPPLAWVTALWGALAYAIVALCFFETKALLGF
jgi:hypothetical protein